MREDELEQHLRPRGATDLGGPPGQRVARQRACEIALAEGTVHDDRDAAVAGEREQPCLGLTVQRVVAELHEVERMVAHDLFELAVPPSFRGRDPDVAQAAFGLHGKQHRQVLLPRQEVVYLQQVEARNAPALPRCFDLLGTARARADPHLVGREQVRG